MYMQIVFFGTPEFAVPSLKSLIEDKEIKVLAVLTQPDRKVGRKQIITPPPIKVLAQEHQIEVLQAERLSKDEEVKTRLKDLKPDFIVTCAYGQILRQDILDIAPVVNVHASLLPEYRGPAPINWSLIHGDIEVGITTMLTDQGVDTGDLLLKASIKIDDSYKADKLSLELANLGAKLIVKTLKEFKNTKAQKQSPCENKAKELAPFMDKKLGEIDFSKEKLILGSANPRQSDFKVELDNSAKNIFNLYRGLFPWPGTYFMHGDNKIIFTDLGYEDDLHKAIPGTILDIDKASGSFTLACQSGVLHINKLKAQGKSELLATEWLNGVRLKQGDTI